MRQASGKNFKLLEAGKSQGEKTNFTSDEPNANERGQESLLISIRFVS